MLHRERQSTNRTELSDLSATDAYSPPWMKDLIMKKKEKLVDIVNAVAKQELTTQLDFSSPSSKAGKTSIGSNTSISTVGKTDVRLSSKAGSGAFTNCCLSCLSQGDSNHSSCESGLNSKKAVHLSNSSSNVNVPIVRSVSSSLVTGGTCSRCLICECIHCINHLRSDSYQLSKCVNKSNGFCDSILKCSSVLNSSQINDELISPGLVATRKEQILRRQLSESSFFPQYCCKCGSNTYALNNDIYWQSLVSENMIDDKIKDDSSEYFNNDRNHHHYEVIIDYKRSNSVNSSEKDSSISNGVDNEESEEREFEYKYGPGIVDKLKLKFLSISIQQQSNNNLIYNKMKRYSSLENIAVSNDSHIYQSQQNQNQQRLNRDKQSQANDLLPLLGKNSAVVNVRSITGGGNRANGNHNHLSHRLYIQHHNSKNIYNNKSTPIVPIMKRAKSMETLLFQDDKDKGRQPLNCLFHHQLSMPETPISSHNDLLLVNENVLIIENTNSDINQCQNRISGDKCNQSTMKSASNLNNELNDEMPKPDTVKTFKRIFEPINSTNGGENMKSGINFNKNNKTKSNYKKALPPTNGVKIKPPVLRATTKNATLKSQSTVNSSSLNIKSQPPVPQMLPSSPTVRSNADKTVVNEDHDKNNNNNKSANTSVMTKPPIAPKRASLTSSRSNLTSGMSAAPIIKNNKMNGFNGNDKVTQQSSNNSINNCEKQENSIKMVTSDALDHNSGTTTTFNGSQQSSTHCPISQKVPTTFDSSDNSTNNPKVNKPIANIKPFTQNNSVLKSENVNNCQSVIDDCNDHDLGHENTNQISIGEKANIQTVETNYINKNSNDDKENKESALQLVISNATSDSRQESSNNTRAVNDENVSPNSCDMVDSNKVDKKIEDRTQADVLKPSLLLNTGVNKNSSNSTSSLWSQQTKKPVNSSTTVVFDFRGKDVKSNLAIQPVPFGVSTSATRKKTQKDTTNATQKGSTNGNLDDSDDDDNYTGSLDIPLPSGIIFTGENVKVGKGSILSTRNKKLNIQFNDSATSTYEYPSEASLLLDIPITNRSTSKGEPNGQMKSEINDSVIECESSNPITSLTTLKTNLALGGSSGGGLASYKPTLIDTPFELGVSRTPKTHQKNEVLTNGNVFETDSGEVDTAKPANSDETTSWSTSSTASDLLF